MQEQNYQQCAAFVLRRVLRERNAYAQVHKALFVHADGGCGNFQQGIGGAVELRT